MTAAGEHRPVRIVTDSAADIPPAMLEGLPITVVPLTVEVEGTVYRDGVDLSRDEFLAILRAGKQPRTSQPSVGAFREVYTELVGGGVDVVGVHIATGLSGTFNASRTAAEEVEPGRVRPIDTRTVSMGTGWIALEAAEMALTGGNLDAIATMVERRRTDQRVYAALDTLEYLQRGGRIGRTSAFLGSALQIKPIVEVRDGGVEPLERVRTARRALERLVALAQAQVPWEHLMVLHVGVEDTARELAARAEAIQDGLAVGVAPLGTVVATYGGPGLVGFAGLVRPHSAPA
ncbi:MAG TPA: DegV family protein [Thermomicrobiaceae bacterium]|nr:DegV family protein [Thermomicrobiaceae bacterium]